MKNLYKLLILLISFIIIFANCSPTKKIVYHTEQLDRLTKKYPESAKQVLDTLFNELIDTAHIKLSIDTTNTRLQADTLNFNNNLNKLLILEDSINYYQKKDLINETEKEHLWDLANRKKEKIKETIREVYKDTTYITQIRQTIETKDTIYTNIFSLTISYKEGKLSHNLIDASVKLPVSEIDISINSQREITIWRWIKHPYTLSLIIIIIIMSILLYILNKK